MGLEGASQKSQSNTDLAKEDNKRDTEGRGVKRKFELDEEQMLQNAKEERAKARKAIDDEKSSKATLPSFWVPALTPSTSTPRPTTTPLKLTPICPGSSPTSTHPLSLKSLITINFSNSNSSSNNTSTSKPTSAEKKAGIHTDGEKLQCPACTKTLTNASKAMMTVPCGHVLCKACAMKFMTPKPPDPHAENADAGIDGAKVRCYVCETDLTEQDRKKNKKDKERKGKDGKEDKGLPKRGLVELRSEGTGFAGGGKNIAKREGVAFQC
ncbi:MAG: hypothetical protein Q9166_006316 [cf. Caloplaca sp. 2 TL-2023]